jgi:hypothetical protein
MSTPDLKQWPALDNDDESLLDHLMALLVDRSQGGCAYSTDGSFAREIAGLPRGLRAMAATHWLDISLALDSITWHFGNFGEPGLVAETEAGLRELGLHELADCFVEARDLMIPLIAQQLESDDDPYELLRQTGFKDRGDLLDGQAWDLAATESKLSFIYGAWVRYARKNPELVFSK